MEKIFTWLVLITLTFSVKAQTYEQNQIDSLLRIVNNPAVEDADRIKPLARLSQLYATQNDSIAATEALSRARMLAMFEKDGKYMMYVYNQELMNCLNAYPRNISTIYSIIDSIYKAIYRTADKEAQARGYQNIAYAKNATDYKYDFDETYKAIAIAEKLPDESTQKYRILFGLYESLYVKNRRKEDKDDTEKYLRLTRQSAEKTGDKDLICWALCRQGENTATYYTNAKDTVSQNFTELEKFLSENSQFISSYNYGVGVVNLLDLYLLAPNPQYQSLIDKHIEHYKKAAPNNPKNQKVLLSIEYLYADSKQDYAESILQSKNLIELYEKEQNEGVWVTYEHLAEVYKKINKYKEGYEALAKSFTAYKKSVNIQTEEQRELNDVKFGVDKQQQQLEQQQNRNLIIILTGIMLIVLLIIAILLVIRQNRINRFEKEKAKLIARQTAVEKEKLGERLMTNAAELARKEQLLDKAKDMDSKQLDKAIRREKKIGRVTNDYAKLFQEIRPEFYDRLAKQAAPNKLSKTDLKYCAYISMRMTNKDLANVLNVGYNTVVSQKHHLKKKFHLSAGDDFDEFIIKLTPPEIIE